MLRTTNTESGRVKGLPGSDPRITVYKGIPFAADTSGKNRWRAPQPVEPWEGVRECFEFAPISMQKAPGSDPNDFYIKEWNVEPDVPMSEDSLALNIWTPARTGDEKLPVYVWIHGGGLVAGYSYEMQYDGERLASRGIVVVTITYRLNVFGFLAHPDLTAEDPEHPANFGFLDQQAALKWVKRNIANFGGDPDNITIGGQSSGGSSVFSQMCAPSSKGLFQRAIAQSCSAGSVFARFPKNFFKPLVPLKEAEQDGKRLLEELLGVKTIEEARKLPGSYIRDKVNASNWIFSNCIDGKFMDMDCDGYLFSDTMHGVPILHGWTGDEICYYTTGDTMEEFVACTRDMYGQYADEVLALWKEAAGSDDLEALKTASRVNINEAASRFIAQEYASHGRDIYCFDFDPEVPGDDMGAFHAFELWFCFETIMKCWRPYDGHHFDLARRMCNYWANFIKTGDPNGTDNDGKPMPRWEKCTGDDPRAIKFYDEISMEEGGLKRFDRLLVEANLKSYKAD